MVDDPEHSAPAWRDLLGDARVIVSGFGKWGGGLYDLTSGAPEALDDLPTSGLALGGGRLWRVLRAPGEQTSSCELLSYDARGVRSYQRYDAVRDPHDVVWFDGAPHISSSWDDAVWRIEAGHDEPQLVWQGSTVTDGWHVNSLVAIDGALHVCAFGRFDRHKAWKRHGRAGAGFVHDLRTGRDVLTGLAHPHTPRRRGDRWYVCESTTGMLTELAAGDTGDTPDTGGSGDTRDTGGSGDTPDTGGSGDTRDTRDTGAVLRRAHIGRFTRGLAFVGPFALVGGNAHRDHDGDRAEIAVVDLRSFAVVERIPMPCLEVYDILRVGPRVVRAVAIGFGANAARAVEQHRTATRATGRRPTPEWASVRLVSPRTAGELAAMGDTLGADEARRCGVRGTLPAAAVAGEVTTWPVEVVNQTDGPLGSVAPRPVKVGARWFRLDDVDDVDDGIDGVVGCGDGGDVIGGVVDGGERAADGTDVIDSSAEPAVNPLAPIPRVLPAGMRTAVDVPIEVPAEAGRYEVRIALRQPGRGWFGARLRTEVVVKSDD